MRICYVHGCGKIAKVKETITKFDGEKVVFYCCEDHYITDKKKFPCKNIDQELLGEDS